MWQGFYIGVFRDLFFCGELLNFLSEERREEKNDTFPSKEGFCHQTAKDTARLFPETVLCSSVNSSTSTVEGVTSCVSYGARISYGKKLMTPVFLSYFFLYVATTFCKRLFEIIWIL